MATTARSFFASNRDTSRLVERAKKFSINVPVVGKVSVPPPDQLAFYGVLGLLAAVNVIDWPVALAIGVGQFVVARHFSDRSDAAPHRGATAPTRTPESKVAQPKTPGPKAASRNAAKATSG
jgi:xanthosine utilization system XapX-like protein